MKKGILVTGANGQLGNAFLHLSKSEEEFSWIFLYKTDLNMQNHNFSGVLDNYDFDILINCAAYTAVDKAEEDKENCYKINVRAVDEMAEYCRRREKILIHFSSDYIYHNDINRPLTEGDQTFPKSIYAKSKLESETVIINHSPASVILRTSWLYNTEGKNFVNTMLSIASSSPEVKVVNDQIGTPTYTPHLADAILTILKNKNFIDRLIRFNKVEIFNFSNEGVCSWYDFAYAVFELSSLQTKCIPIPSSGYPTPAKRPSYSVLNKKRIKSLFNIEIPHWREGLKECLKRKLKTDPVR